MVFIPCYILILAGLIIVDYFAGILIDNANGKRKKKFFLIISILANISILGVFKYYNFFVDNISQLFTYFEIDNIPIYYLSIALPIGLSFHTFQSMSYTIEVYRGNQKSERNFITYSLYVMFFPQLVAGPIERPQNLLPQLHKNHYIDYSRIATGLKQMLWGFFKKIVIADRLSELVKQGYGNIDNHDGISLLIYTYFFAIQIYCDFSGYSDIAIGSAKVLGINLRENFRTPYFAKSIKEFWQRWHISLSTWFKDYVYIPLGGKKVEKWRWFYNIIIVFLLSGLWHGANWTFVIWGLLHGTYLILGHFIKKYLGSYFFIDKYDKNLKYYFQISFQMIVTFNLVSFAWIFFRATNIDEALNIIVKILYNRDYFGFNNLSILRVNDSITLLVTIALLVLFFISDSFMDKLIKQQNYLKNKKYGFVLYSTILAFILIFGHFTDTNFIYFQF